MYLIVAAEEPLRTLVRGEDSPGALDAFGRRYDEVEFPEQLDPFLGFYDWLRASDGRVVGVSLIAAEETRAALRQFVGPTVSITWTGDCIVEVLFEARAEIDWSISVDQEFSTSRLYVAEDQSAALLFTADLVMHALPPPL